MHKPESVQENETLKILCDIKIQGNFKSRPKGQISCKLPSKKEKACCLVYFAIPADHRVKIKIDKINKS